MRGHRANGRLPASGVRLPERHELRAERRPYRVFAAWQFVEAVSTLIPPVVIAMALLPISSTSRPIVLALLFFAGFTWRELTARQPMLRLRLFRLTAIALGTAGSLALVEPRFDADPNRPRGRNFLYGIR